MAGLRLEHIYKVYPNGTKAVSDFTMDIEDKEFIVFVGPSGCGKSTTLRMIAGLEDISAGELYIGDRIVNDVEPKDRDIAMVFQNYALYPHMTVYENMAFGLKLRHVPNAEIHEKVLWAAQVLDLTEYLDRKPKAMSGGQRQRVALGRAILRNPKVMLLDEPLSNLDAKLRAQMRSEIAKLHDQLQTTFIYVTHDQVEAMTLGTRVVVMRLGRIMQIDTPKNLYDYPNNLFVAGFIGTPQMNFFHATLTKKASMIHMDFKWSKESLEIPQALLAKVKPQYFDGESEVIVGVRCEHISLDPEVVSKSKYVLNVRISHFEELGNETLIYADINEAGDGFTESSTRVIIKGTSNYGLVKGAIAKAAIDVTRLHMFDMETENTINPRIPSDNLITGKVSKGVLKLGTLSYPLPNAIHLTDGTYDVLIPASAIKLGNESTNTAELVSLEKIDGLNIAGLAVADQLLFTTTKEEMKANMSYSLELDYTQLEFRQEGKVVHSAISEFDKVNAIFLNHSTAKAFVGDTYDPVVQERLQSVDDTFLPQIQALKEQFEINSLEANKVDSKAVMEQKRAGIEEKKKGVEQEIAKLKAEFSLAEKSLKEEHLQKNVEITQKVNETYAKIKNDELSAFASFKEMNKDRDAYRKRAAEIRDFKSNFALEKKNELDKQINLEAIRYESDLNALKGNYKRNVESLKKEYKDYVSECQDAAYPLKKITKEYQKNLKEVNKKYQEAKNLANIIFFLKTNDLVTLCTDAISNKMIQSLGVKVFTKQYLVEIPHNAYQETKDAGLELQVKEILDYGTRKYLHCNLDDGTGIKDIYMETERTSIDSQTIHVTFDVTKIHITEKSMEIKIY
ncbi:MAG: sn-glycerol-3-phosphate ABC transporter ATP-binding protein UgpC [Anaeroplasmataceae bacterium]|nr:sn-glycerol-3-phosphate ABC transporter ATP-binding protein UgpC [Anaeroplasmataceae bacterium]